MEAKARRHIVKTLSWRTLASLTTFCLSLWVTGTVATSSLIMSYELVSKNILYYLHETFWSCITWGINQHQAAPKRHLCKGITWRILASSTTFLITWAVTHNTAIGLSIASYEAVLKIILYYGHEALWNKTAFGLKHALPLQKGV